MQSTSYWLLCHVWTLACCWIHLKDYLNIIYLCTNADTLPSPNSTSPITKSRKLGSAMVFGQESLAQLMQLGRCCGNQDKLRNSGDVNWGWGRWSCVVRFQHHVGNRIVLSWECRHWCHFENRREGSYPATTKRSAPLPEPKSSIPTHHHTNSFNPKHIQESQGSASDTMSLDLVSWWE